jgi:glycosyltransferase involved in cell wall biosynthesis
MGHASRHEIPRVAVFGMTTGPLVERDLAAIVEALGQAAESVRGFELVVFGRGALEAERALRRRLNGSHISLSVLGLLSAEEIGRLLADADALLFVRGGISSRRGSVIAALACGVPIVGFESEETDTPITEAGVMLVPEDDPKALGKVLAQVLGNEELRRELRGRSLRVYEDWFSWDRIALRLLGALGSDPQQKQRLSAARVTK